GELITRNALGQLPHGTWSAEDFLDDDGISGELIPMKVTTTIDGERLRVDFTGTAAAVRGPVNVPFGLTETMCQFVLKSLTTFDAPCNAGNFRPLEVVAPPGCLFHAVYPSATFTLWSAIVGLELIYKALARGMPGRLAASSGGDVPGFMMAGVHPDTGRFFAVSNNETIGWGATARHDGANVMQHLSGSQVRNTPIEQLELKTGMFIERLEIRTDSGGAGRFRGGV